MSHARGTHAFAAQQTPDAPHTAVAAATRPTHDDIARRAYDIYVKTGRRQGQCKQNWQQAEQDLRNEGAAALRSASSRPPGELKTKAEALQISATPSQSD